MNTIPIDFAYQPTNGTFVISCLSRKCRGTGAARNSAQMSMVDWWLATNKWLRDQYNCSGQQNSRRAPAHRSNPGAQQAAAVPGGQNGQAGWMERSGQYGEVTG